MNELYAFTIPVFVKSLEGLKTILEKAQNHLKEHGGDEAALLDSRLAPDMFPLIKQVQIACDNAKGAAARLASIEIPKYDDTEKTINDLLARIDKTLSFLGSISEEQFKDSATVKATLPYFPGQYMIGYDYAREYAIPNFLFHVVIAYGLIRHRGVQIGKADYINGLPLKDLE